MKSCEAIDKLIQEQGAGSYYVCTLVDGSRFIFYVNDFDERIYLRFLVSCCALTSEAIVSLCENFTEDFLILHPEDIEKIEYIDWFKVQKLLEATDSEFIFDADENFESIEDYISDFLSDGGTICFKGDPFKSFGESRVSNYSQAINIKNAVSHQVQAPVQGVPVVSCGKTYPSTPTITGRSRRIL